MTSNGHMSFNHNTDGAGQLIGGCHLEHLINADGPTRCKVIYSGRTLYVQFFDPKSGMYDQCIKVDNVRLPYAGFIGFSASTGAASAEHDLLSVTTATFSGHLIDQFEKTLTSKKKKRGLVFFLAGLCLLYLVYTYVLKALLRRYNRGGKGDAFSQRMSQIYGAI